jgi:uncharacterized protein YjiS (DUF1127 family)
MTPRVATRALPAHLPPLSRMLVSVALTLAAWDNRRRSRAALGRLDSHLLQDIGLGHDRAASECTKPFWQD